MSNAIALALNSPRPRIVSVGVASPRTQYTQEAIAEFLGVPEGPGRRLFRNSGIETRSLHLEVDESGTVPYEDQGQLLARHRRGALELGGEAVERCLSPAGLQPRDIDFLCCVSSTGFMLPGLTAMYIRRLGFRQDCQRIDVVGMGCNAALNGLNATASWAMAHPRHYALMVCCEINSAVYVQDDRVVTALVNSLFADGCGAVLLASDAPQQTGPEILGFSSHVVPEAWRAISYHWSAEYHKFELFLDKSIPNVLGAHSPAPITALLETFNLCRCDISHWLVHAGGKKVIAAIGDSNGLMPHDLRHATNVLRQWGNLSSATIVFSYDQLMKEGVVAPGDYGVMVTMGPGATIETALVRW